MSSPLSRPHKQHPHIRAAIEIGFIVFLFYANLLMGEYTHHSGAISLHAALRDIVTPTNFLIALLSAIVGHFIFESLRKYL